MHGVVDNGAVVVAVDKLDVGGCVVVGSFPDVDVVADTTTQMFCYATNINYRQT